MTLHLGILLALLCAFATNLGFFFKHRGCCEAPTIDIRHPLRSAKGLWCSKWFAIGMAVGGGAWGLHVAAISLAPLSVVQVVLSGGVVLIAVMADRIFGYEVGKRQWWGLAFTAIGLILLGLTMPQPHGSHSAFSLAAMVGFEGVLFALGGLLILGPRAGAPRWPLPLPARGRSAPPRVSQHLPARPERPGQGCARLYINMMYFRAHPAAAAPRRVA